MTQQELSPKIVILEWGTVQVEDGTRYKDAKLYPGGSRAWDWNETGTSHVPGIQPADVEELLDKDAEVIVLSKGINQRLQVKQDTKEMLRQNGVRFHILQSEKAVQKYNELRKNHKVAALIHSTC